MVTTPSFAPKNSRGFALVILAVILSIAGVLLLTLMQTESEKLSGQIRGNNDQLQKITKAIYAFYDKNGYFPCPANLKAPMSATDFGVASDPSVCNLSACPTTSPANGIVCSTVSGATTVKIGAVPVRTLGLADTDALDQWNNRYTYVMDTNKWGSFTVNDLLGNNSSAAALVFSHGKDGRGSYLKNGTANPQDCTLPGSPSATASELENCDSLTAANADRLFVKANWDSTTTNYFDDIVNPLYKCPGDVTSCALWYDANDAGSIVFTVAKGGNPVKIWRDKSGTGRDAVQATAANKPTYNTTGASSYTNPVTGGTMGAITFDGTTDKMPISNPPPVLPNWTSFAIIDRQVNGDKMLALSTSLSGNTFYSIYLYTGNNVYTGDGSYYTAINPDTTVAATVWSTQTNASTPKIWKNGLAQTGSSASASTPGGIFDLLGARTASVEFANGKMEEVVLYSSALAAADRKKVECYLGAKWGLPVSGCCPMDVPYCSLWLDATDVNNSGVSPVNGDSVTAWKDKSGYGNDANAATAPSYVTGVLYNSTKPVVRFNGTSQYMNNGSFSGTTASTTIGVAKNSGGSGNQRIFHGNASADQYFFFGSSYPNFAAFYGNGTWNDTTATSTSIATASVISSVITGSGTNTITNYVNGTLRETKNGNPAAYTGYVLGTGASTGASQYWNGDIAELVMYPSALSAADRQKVECYLGDKWGIVLTGNAGAAACCPANVAGCSAWYDANAGIGYTIDAATVATWKDKSGFPTNHDATAAGTARPAWNSSGVNSYTNPVTGLTMGAVLFDGTTDKMTITNGLGTPSVWTSFAVVSRAAAAKMVTIASSNTTATSASTFRMHTTNLANLTDSARSTDMTLADATTTGNIWVSKDNAGFSLWKNGATVSLAAAGAAGAGTLDRLGGRGTSTDWAAGKMMEVIFYPIAVSDPDRKKIECYLADKWGLCPGLPSTGATYCNNIGAPIAYCGANVP